jgi:DNA-binding transcriptional LysR family regulator
MKPVDRGGGAARPEPAGDKPCLAAAARPDGRPAFSAPPKCLRPTPLALQIAPKIDALIQLANETLGSDRKFDPAASDRLFRIAANDFAGSLLMARLIADFAVQAPSARLSFCFAIGPVGFKGLRDNELDVVIGRFNSLPEGLIGTTLFEDGYSVIARAGHPSIKSGLDLEIPCSGSSSRLV